MPLTDPRAFDSFSESVWLFPARSIRKHPAHLQPLPPRDRNPALPRDPQRCPEMGHAVELLIVS